MDNATLENEIENFFVERGHATTTQDTYRRVLLDLIKIPQLEKLTAAELLRFAERPEWGNSMQYVAVSASKAFLRYLYGARHPALSAKKRRMASKKQRTLSVDQATVLLASFDPNTPKGARDLAIAALAIDTRLRVAELSRLCLLDVDLLSGRLQVIVKGGEWGDGVFSPETAHIIAHWLDYRQPAPGVDQLFLSLQGPTAGQGMTVNGLKTTVKRWGQKVGFKLSPHDFCRTFATLATQNGAPKHVTQRAGRWKKGEMVELYTRSMDQEAIRPYLPVHNLLGVPNGLFVAKNKEK